MQDGRFVNVIVENLNLREIVLSGRQFTLGQIIERIRLTRN
jgi:hypothetical protein